jgi:hypothetical protein
MILFNKIQWLRKIILSIVGLVVLIVIISVVASGCTTQQSTATPASGSAAKGCHDLAAWENSTASGNSVQEDIGLQKKIAGDARGTKFAKDFAAWATSWTTGSDPIALSDQIVADCRPWYADVINSGP